MKDAFKWFHTRRTQGSSLLISLLSLGLLTQGASASSESSALSPNPTLEVVQSVPVETTLAVPGIRQTQTVWLEMIASARNTLDIEEFYIDNQPGQALDPVITAVQAAASRGVKVRLLVDLKFYKTYPKTPDLLSQTPNIEVKTIDFSSGVQHAKYFVVDQSNAYLGSANFDWLALSHIHEIGLHLLDGEVAKNLESVFAKDWVSGVDVRGRNSRTTAVIPEPALAGVPAPEVDATAAAQPTGLKFLASPPALNPTGIAPTLPALVQLLDSARKSLRIQVYQYSTRPAKGGGKWLELDSAIRRAASRGVHVQLMVDAVALKVSSLELKALSSLKNVEVRSVVVPEWSGGHLAFARLIHSKYLTVDGSSSWVGTENWSEGYFTVSRNVGVILQSTEVSHQLDQIFDQVWNSGYSSNL
ncbi:MAG: hypothetical protein H7222_04710 [Methylotenera sp.]|nr:hypothetical protein [Oligoflexia bacterium]